MLSIDDYMQKALFDQEKGFYEKESIHNHFKTPLTLNSGFRSLLVRFFKEKNQPFLEIGPAQGQLAKDFLASGFKQNIDLYEKSKNSSALLKKQFQQNSSVNVLDTFPDFFQGSIFIQEVLDCFPAQWFVYKQGCFYEKRISTDFQSFDEVYINEKIDYFDFLLEAQLLKDNVHFMYSQEATDFLKKALTLKKSSLMIVDYGYLSHDLIAANSLVSCPLRAYRDHQQEVSFWEQQGRYDLTYDIDFSWVLSLAVEQGAQVDFYGTLAQFIVQFYRSEDDLSLLKPFLDPRQLGEAFKVALLNI